jgi:hypothetical protein
VNTDSHVNLLESFFLGVMGFELGLNRLRALHSVDDGEEINQEGVAPTVLMTCPWCSATVCWMI